jgi:hypothetical protein
MSFPAEEQFVKALGGGMMQSWANLSQDVQHVLFEAAVATSGQDDKFREELAVFLHEHHPRTG